MIIDNIGVASIPNTLSLSNKFNFEDEKGYNLDVFFKVFIEELKNKLVSIKDEKYTAAYFLTSEFCSNLKLLNVNKKKLFETYILALKKTLR
jgi:RNAse (barnase) inhibitor barstar